MDYWKNVHKDNTGVIIRNVGRGYLHRLFFNNTFDNIQGSVFHFIKHPAQVLTKQSYGKYLNTSDEQYYDHQGWVTFYRFTKHQGFIDNYDSINKRYQGGKHAGKRHYF